MVTYRQANSFDLPVFALLDKEFFPYAPWSTSQYQEEISQSTRYFVVALDEGGKIIGYAGVFAPGLSEADILTVGVVKEHRREGIANELIALTTNWAKTQGSTAMMLEVKSDNMAAIALYESLGYTKLNIRKDYFGSGLDAQVMRLELM